MKHVRGRVLLGVQLGNTVGRSRYRFVGHPDRYRQLFPQRPNGYEGPDVYNLDTGNPMQGAQTGEALCAPNVIRDQLPGGVNGLRHHSTFGELGDKRRNFESKRGYTAHNYESDRRAEDRTGRPQRSESLGTEHITPHKHFAAQAAQEVVRSKKRKDAIAREMKGIIDHVTPMKKREYRKFNRDLLRKAQS